MMTLAKLVDINSLTGWIGVPAVAWKSNLDSLGTDSARRSDGSPQRAKKKSASRKRTARVGTKQGFVCKVS